MFERQVGAIRCWEIQNSEGWERQILWDQKRVPPLFSYVFGIFFVFVWSVSNWCESPKSWLSILATFDCLPKILHGICHRICGEQHLVPQVLDVSEERDEVNKAACCLCQTTRPMSKRSKFGEFSVWICLKLISSPVRLKMQRTSQIPQ